MIKWGAFYNAVAAGLCIGDSDSLHLDSEWLAMSINNLVLKFSINSLCLKSEIGPFTSIKID